MADDKFPSKFEVKPSAIPDRVLRDFENVKHPSAIKLLSVSKNYETPNEGKKTNGLTMLEIKEFANDPFWMNVRKTLMILSVLVFILLFLASILIIVCTPGCSGGPISDATFDQQENGKTTH